MGSQYLKVSLGTPSIDTLQDTFTQLLTGEENMQRKQYDMLRKQGNMQRKQDDLQRKQDDLQGEHDNLQREQDVMMKRLVNVEYVSFVQTLQN
jgi:FtsZ-binding cell division protein ZapB